MEIRSWRARRNRRYSRLWWTAFLTGCMVVLVLLTVTDGVNLVPWLVLGGLLGMIRARHRHQREQAAGDARVDAHANRVAEVEVRMGAELVSSAQRLDEANEQLARLVAQVRNASRRQDESAKNEPPKN